MTGAGVAFLGGPTFVQPDQSNLKILKKLWLAGEGPALRGGALLFWTC